MKTRLERNQELSSQLENKYNKIGELEKQLLKLKQEVLTLKYEKIKNEILANLENNTIQKNSNVVDFFLSKSTEELEDFLGPDFAKIIALTLKTVKQINTDGLSKEEFTKLKLSAFFHNIEGSFTIDENHSPEKKSPKMSNKLLKDLNCKTEEIEQVQFFIEHYDDLSGLISESECLESLARKIQETKEDIAIYGGYNPTKHDYLLLSRLCEADLSAKSVTTDLNKISKTQKFETLISEAYDLSLEMSVESIKNLSRIVSNLDASVENKVYNRIMMQIPTSETRKKNIVVDDELKQYEQELRKVYIYDGGPIGREFQSKLKEFSQKGMTIDQYKRLSKILSLEINNKIIGVIDEVHKSGKLTQLFDVTGILAKRNKDASKLLQQYEDNLIKYGMKQSDYDLAD